ncbi:MAG: SH3 domain-containing protein [Pirellulales bacterium]
MASLFLAALPALPAAAAEEFPYTAYVNAEDVYVRSGPGRNYYPTMKLAQGATVEVYRHDPGGWLAIRPPEGSFTWVSARYLKPDGAGLGEVVEENVVARVGSQFSQVRDVIQVRLEIGELVEILEEYNGGGQTWYKIAPPSGEFRWISGRYINGRPPHDGVSQPRSEQDPPGGASESQSPDDHDAAASPEAVQTSAIVPREADALSEEDAEIEAALAARRQRRDETVQIAASSRPASDAEPDSPRTARSNELTRQTSAEQSVDPPAEQPALLDADELYARLEVIELALSQMAAEEPTVWQFDELARRTEMLLNQSSTAVQRGRVRNVLHRIARLEDIKARFDRIHLVQRDTDRANGTLDVATSATEPADPQQARRVAYERRFDGVGVLRPVVSRNGEAPRYAIVDELNDVAAFVTPGPGVNLESHLGQRLGVSGTRGYIAEYRRPHIMVSRVTPLERTAAR